MHIRQAQLADLQQMISADAYAQNQNSETRREELQGWLEQGAVWVVEENSKVLGFIVLSRTFFSQRFIHLVCVAPCAQRLGLAKRMIKEMVDLAPQNKIFTSTNASNLAAQNLFEHMGFCRSGVIENLDVGDPEYIYFKPPVVRTDA